MRALLAAVGLACVLGHPDALAGVSGDDCDGVMAALVAAQSDAWAAADVVDSLDAAINAPPARTGGCSGRWRGAVDDLIGALNTAAIAEERAHQAHCY